jgi:hypothetical protein
VSLGGCNKFFIGGGFHVLITLEITYKIKKVDECTMQIRKQSKFYSRVHILLANHYCAVLRYTGLYKEV